VTRTSPSRLKRERAVRFGASSADPGPYGYNVNASETQKKLRIHRGSCKSQVPSKTPYFFLLFSLIVLIIR
jgi:hypothetical protein